MDSKETEDIFKRFIDKSKPNSSPSSNLDINLIIETFGKKYYLELLSIVSKHDPMGILGLAPITEYEPEVSTIIVQLEGLSSKKEIFHLVKSEFKRWFSEISQSVTEILEEMAEDIFDWKNQNGKRNLFNEYLTTAENFLKDNNNESEGIALFYLQLALLLEEDNKEIEQRIARLEYHLFGTCYRTFRGNNNTKRGRL